MKKILFCPICKNDNLHMKVKGWDDYILFQCMNCEIGHVEPFNAPGSDWYANAERYELAFDNKLPVDWRHKMFLSKKIINYEDIDLLDIGAGTGNFLNEASKMGYKTTGIDFDKKRVEFGINNYKLNLLVIDLKSHIKNVGDKKYDVVTAFELIEHLDDPIDFVSDVKKVLKKNGTFVISTPNWDRTFKVENEIGDYPPHHLTWWTKKSLKNFLEINGFDNIKIIEQPIDLKYLLSLKIKTGFSDKASKIFSGTDGENVKNKKMFFIRMTRNIKKIILSILDPVSFILNKITNLKGIGLYVEAKLRE